MGTKRDKKLSRTIFGSADLMKSKIRILFTETLEMFGCIRRTKGV